MSFTSLHRDARLVVVAKAVSWLGDDLAVTALLLRLQSGGHGAGAVAGLLIANLAPIVLLSGVAGRLVDRWENRRLLLVTSALQAMVCLALAAATSSAAVLALVAALGGLQAFSGAAWTALLPAIVGREQLPRALGLAQAATTATGIAAPALAGVLVGAFGTGVPMLADACSFAFALVAAAVLRVRRRAEAAVHRADGGLTIVRRDQLLAPLFVLFALFVLIGSMVNVVDVFLIRQTLHASTTWYGAVGAVFGVGMLAGSLAGGRLGSQPVVLARWFVVAVAVLAASIAVMGVVPSVVVLPAVVVGAGAGNGMMSVTLGALVMGRAHPDARGRVGALLNAVGSGTQMAAFAVAGGLAGVLSPRAIFLIAGCAGLLAPALLGRGVLRAARRSARADSSPMTATAVAA